MADMVGKKEEGSLATFPEVEENMELEYELAFAFVGLGRFGKVSGLMVCLKRRRSRSSSQAPGGLGAVGSGPLRAEGYRRAVASVGHFCCRGYFV